jgi:cytochrome c553
MYMKINPHQVIGQIMWLAVLATSIASVNAQSISAGERKYGVCARCHGINGRSIKVNYPILAGQAAPYILLQLHAFKQGRRSNPNMNGVMPQLSDADMRDLAAFLEASEPYSSPYESEAIKAIRGKKMAESAQCVSCHLGDSNSRGGEFPVIQGQHRDYVVKQLRDFKAGRRTNDYTGLMQNKTQSLSDTDIEDLGNYFATVRFVSLPRKRP